MTNLKLPFEIAGYRIVRRLGLGGMATVYLGIQRSLGRPVAIKVLAADRTQTEEMVKRFEHEARTIARLDHPHIVSIFDVGRTSTGQIYYTMPYLPNGDLSSRNLREDQRRVLDIIRSLADALGYAHEHGIVHRDVKPENVLFDKLDRAMLADFGIALSDARQSRVTREGATIGSSGYMSPEQARSQPLDGRSDIYSLGVLCYELLTGEMPFHGPDTLSVALAHIENPVPRLPHARRIWQPFIDKALAKRPEARFQSAEEVLAALAAIELRLAAPPPHGIARWWQTLVDRMAAIPRRTRALAIGLAIVAAFAGLVAMLPRVPGPAASPPAIAATARTVLGDNAAAAAAERSPGPIAATTDATESAAAGPPAPNADQLLAEAKQFAAEGRLIRPAGDNAAQRYLAVLQEDPGREEARRGIEDLFAPLAKRADNAIATSDADTAGATIERALSLAQSSGLEKSKAFGAFRASVRHEVERRRAHVSDAFDTSELAPLAPLVPALAKLDAEQASALKADLDRPRRLMEKGGTFRDEGGPRLAVIPAQKGSPAVFSIGVSDVTRGEYERFAIATGRPAAKCRESRRLFARTTGLTWNTPGFVQTDDHPVVCVSWNDAHAYVEWLSRRTGKHYRLPTQKEWLRIALSVHEPPACGVGNFDDESCGDGYAHTAPVGHFAATRYGLYDVVGNVEVWTADCSEFLDDGSCRSHAVRGLSWRSARDDLYRNDPHYAEDDIGFATIGFRVLREISADNHRPAG